MADANLATLLLRLAVSMGVVICLMLLAARILRRSAAGMGIGGKRTTRTPIAVSALQPLTKTAHVAVVRAGGRELVLGITDHQVSLLHSSIEPRDTLEDLDGDPAGSGRTTTASPLLPQTVSTRIVHDGPADPAAGSPAWMDALEMLREKTVRR